MDGSSPASLGSADDDIRRKLLDALWKLIGDLANAPHHPRGHWLRTVDGRGAHLILRHSVAAMAIPELDLARIRGYCDTKVPAHLHDQVRVEARVRGNNVTIVDCRPPWNESVTEWSQLPVARLRYSPATAAWTLYWADRDGRWHPYQGLQPDQPAQALIDEINNDPTSIFWG